MVDKAQAFASIRAETMLSIAPELREDLEDGKLSSLHDDVEVPLTWVLSQMEAAGVQVDREVLASLSGRFGQLLTNYERECHELAGGPFNIGSPKQLATILFDTLGLPVQKRTKTGPSTDASVLEALKGMHPIVDRIHDWRSVSKLKSTYTDVLPMLADDHDRIHTNFRQAVAATGRLSSYVPNLQNIPIRTEEGRRIRDAFIPADGMVLLSADYSQVELRVLAHLSNDPGLTKAFQDGVDIHSRTASEVFDVPETDVTFEQRSAAKAINFGLMYGMGPFRLSNDLGIEFAEAKRYIARYFERFPAVKTFMDSTIAGGRAKGYVSTILGRRRYVSDLRSKNHNRRSAAERAAINTPVQGSAADLLKLAMLKIASSLKEEKCRTRMILQVHDELVFEVPSDELESVIPLVKNDMENVYPLSVPLTVSAASGLNWNEAH
ncbi:MAG: DNA polymerase I [Myxococcota bacterium]|nr:DNA polymerase I [Myxococcota bacterium]